MYLNQLHMQIGHNMTWIDDYSYLKIELGVNDDHKIYTHSATWILSFIYSFDQNHPSKTILHCTLNHYMKKVARSFWTRFFTLNLHIVCFGNYQNIYIHHPTKPFEISSRCNSMFKNSLYLRPFHKKISLVTTKYRSQNFAYI